ncbi:hypothetical protein [Paucisalibacillus globulus]|uniref:hypothetical protein n=1 Tax=Paucisalibacillus globulus TaxID=351095 RepID=UPI000423CE99|nr:hypothetical protein [Paucisalibacillus globulus]
MIFRSQNKTLLRFGKRHRKWKSKEVTEQTGEKEEQTAGEQFKEVDDNLDVERFKTEDINEQ